MASLGLDIDSLYYITFEEYLKQHKELMNIDDDLKEKRYNHYEDKRQFRIKAAIKRREEIIRERNKSKKMIKSSSVSYILEQGSTLLNNEREKLRLLKNQQMTELKNIIEYEFKLDSIRKQNEEKLRIQREKEEEIKKQKMILQKEREARQRMLDKKMMERQQEELNMMLRRQKELEAENKKKFIEEQQRLKEQEKERKRKIKEQQLREREFKQKVEMMFVAQQEKLEEKIKELKLKEDQQKKNLEEIRKERDIETRTRQKITEDKIKKCLARNDNLMSDKQGEYVKKQEYAEEMRKKFAEEKKERARLREMQRKEKEKDILNVLKKNEEIILSRVLAYNKKQKEIEERQKLRDLEAQRKMIAKKIELDEKEKRCLETRKRNDEMIEKNREVWLSRINGSDARIRKVKEENNRDLQERMVEFGMKKEDIEDNIKIKENTMKFNRLKRLEEIQERDNRIRLVQLEKNKIYEERKKMVG